MKLKYFFGFVFLLLLSFSCVLSANPIAHYNFTSLNDEFGSYDLTNNGATQSTLFPTFSGGNNSGPYSFNFDGTSNYIATNTQYGFSDGDNTTIVFWVRSDDMTAERQYISAYNSATLKGFYCGQYSGGLYCIMFNGASNYKLRTNGMLANTWYMITMFIYDDGTYTVHINTVNTASNSQSGTISTSVFPGIDWTFGRRANTASLYMDGKLDEITIFDYILNSTEETEMYQNGRIWDILPTYENFTINATDLYTNDSIQNFSVFITNGTQDYTYYTNTSEITTEILQNDTSLWNITFFNTTYHNRTYINYNVSTNLEGELNPLFSFKNITFSNYKEYNGTNYTRNLTATVNFYSYETDTPVIKTYLDGVLVDIFNISENGSITYSLNTTSLNEGNQNYSIIIYNDYGNYSTYQNFTFDLYNPAAEIMFDVITGFSIDVNVTSRCNDTITPLLLYNMTFNGYSLFYGNLTNATEQTNETMLGTGTNTGIIVCRDFFGSTETDRDVEAYAKQLIIIDEQNASNFDVNNVSSLKAYYSNVSYFDFKTIGTNEVNFTSTIDGKLRFEIVYSDGTIITRYIDVTLVNSSELRVCANTEGTTHYENLFGASSERKVKIINLFSQCYIGADYTSFAYEDGLILKAYTINSKYNLYASDEDGNDVLLALLDGSISIYHNIDVLEFKKKGYDFSITGDGLTFEKYADDVILIRYDNLREDAASSVLTITNLDDSTVVLTSTFADPNSQITLWNISEINITNTTLFKAEIDQITTEGISRTVKRYFTPDLKTGILKNEFVYIVTLILLLFTLTLFAVSVVFSWAGIITILTNLVLISLAIGGGLMTFWLSLHIIILIFFILYIKNISYPLVS